MAQNIIDHIRDLINNAGLALEEALEEAGLSGADPAYWRRLINRQQGQQNKPRKSRRTGGSRKPSKRANYASQVLSQGQAMAEQLDRVNGRDQEEEEPGDETHTILWTVGGELRILEVSNV